MMKRCLIADKLRAYACFLVVLGHVIRGIRTCGLISVPVFFVYAEDFIWSFHVYLFMFLSGFVYHYTGGFQRKGSPIKFLFNKFLSLAVPYYVFSIVYIIVNSMTSAANNSHSISEVLTLFYKPIEHFWFIYALFFCFVFTVILELIFKNKWIVMGIFVVLRFLPVFVPQINYGFLEDSVNFSMFFYGGVFFKSLSLGTSSVQKNVTFVALLFLHIGISGLLISYFGSDKTELVTVLWAIVGIAASVIFMNLLDQITFISKPILVMAKHSFPIYLIHPIFTAATRIVLLKLSVDFYSVQLIAGVLIGIFVPLLISIISKKIVVTELLFTPTSKAVWAKLKGNENEV